MIVLDTHIWVWWVHGDPSLPVSSRALLDSSEQTGIAVSAISCWEIAKLVERGRLTLPCPVIDWLQQALSYPGVRLIDLSPRICVESTRLPREFHRDPADQIIVATARVLDVPLMTADGKILKYQRLPESVETPEEAVFPYEKGKLYVFFLVSLKNDNGQVIGSLADRLPELLEDQPEAEEETVGAPLRGTHRAPPNLVNIKNNSTETI